MPSAGYRSSCTARHAACGNPALGKWRNWVANAVYDPRKRDSDMHAAAKQRPPSDRPDATRSEPEVSDSLSEEILDIAIEYTFPASDPISIVSAYRAREREEHAEEETAHRK
jgi:hypothetical protein